MSDESEPPPPITRLEIDAAIARLFAQHRRGRREHTELVALVKTLVAMLTATGAVEARELERRRKRLADVMLEFMNDDDKTAIGLPARDKYTIASPAELDCAAILPICKARCCQLSVCLSPQDLDEGKLGWNYEIPYLMKKRPDKLCVYNQPETGRCEVYEYRPGTCRSYDCRKDPRIWNDFEKRILAD